VDDIPGTPEMFHKLKTFNKLKTLHKIENISQNENISQIENISQMLQSLTYVLKYCDITSIRE
jgi:hypothetical protein